ncbi:MAG: DsbA family protein [Tomitella sp.]|nr:DsbA family protein [Tomitella sp.]
MSPSTRPSPGPAKSSNTRRRMEVALFVALVVIAVVLGAIVFTGGDGDDSASGPNGSNPASISDADRNAAGDEAIGPLGDLARRVEGDPMAMGPVDAPIVLVEYADYRCPFCAKFSTDIEPELVERYVDSGELRIEWRDMPIYGEESALAARAGRAAAMQGKFWEFNSALYAAAPGNGHPEMSPEKLRGFAEDAGVPNIGKFEAQMNSDEFEQVLQLDTLEAQQLGIPATPAFSINGYPILGAQPLGEFTTMIDTQLEKAEAR